MSGEISDFKGFPVEFFTFFEKLKQNNNREWFTENKPAYEKYVVAPMQSFIVTFEPRLVGISPHFIASPKKVGGSMFRIHRDVRFAKDKRPYKEHAACQFRHEAGKDAHAPGYYLHLATDGVVAGAGVWLPAADKLLKIRQRIVDKASLWQQVLEAGEMRVFVEGIEGETLVRPPKGFSVEERHLQDIKRKSFIVKRRFSLQQAQSAEFLSEVADTYLSAAPLMRFLCAAVEVSYD
ncbi:MAG: DUF2461 domain-containing protein [Hahellaceae bacterium]|nr:DUF2461 domain-containing protein [Hahellaceae bacterium]MCP5210239.1 DUF2461 domain-containing protein [Hahellaceae bacterium]